MSRAFLLKDIALQAGLSLATVDRVLNDRPGVREHTVRRVKQAIGELEQQRDQVGLSGRKFVLDVVMEAPARFSEAVRQGLEQAMPSLQPAIFRARYHLAETRNVETTVGIIDALQRRGSNGVFLKAPDVTEVRAAAARLVAAGIPVVTLVTDLPDTGRQAYVGMDNRAAGETAAYLLGEWLGGGPARILVTISSNRFRGEEEREIGFRQALRERYPGLGIVEVSEGHGLDRDTGRLACDALRQHSDIAGVYSIGGGNLAVIEAFAALGRPCRAFVGHDLDADNIALLRAGRISAVLHHDLGQDMRSACLHVMRAHGLLPKSPVSGMANIQIITPFNLPQMVAWR
ncbi:LacI family DNA-binding transcriptional regulator [Mesorhizobium neociceri]|uniref:LacI family DNA-binding transcriptional regulator n=1 Tax=Mesorhizobium neociceri TaxID=1307853 RepID=A0A838B5W6_9HYPH|nr:LacI family DNA-binding transcriptional regulator [Mesorhizobium neociceri]MBA1141462.1 LacI family DNA-binding transcriptional regulator [Mesorhizobium neociceri]